MREPLLGGGVDVEGGSRVQSRADMEIERGREGGDEGGTDVMGHGRAGGAFCPGELRESAPLMRKATSPSVQGNAPSCTEGRLMGEPGQKGEEGAASALSLYGTVQCIALGQLLSLLVTITSVSSSVLASQGVSIPASQSFLNYLLLALFFGLPLLFQRQRINVSLSSFALTSLLDVQGNYLVVLAFRYTSLPNVTLLDCWAIPCAMLLTARFFAARYTRWHALGAALCTAGLATLLFSDAHTADRAQVGPMPLLGDALVIFGASLYAGSNVMVEHFSHNMDHSTVLGLLGCFGSLISLLQLLVLERQELSQVVISISTVVPFLAFSLALFAFYALVPQMLQMGGAAFFNLSLLTSDVWAIGISSLWLHKDVGPLYFLSLLAVTVGLTVYSLQPQPKREYREASLHHVSTDGLQTADDVVALP